MMGAKPPYPTSRSLIDIYDPLRRRRCLAPLSAVVTGQAASAAAFGNVLISSVTMNLGYFLTLTRNFGQPGTFASGDLNGDGTVNLADLLLLTRNFGHALPAATTAIATPAGSASVPGVAKRRV